MRNRRPIKMLVTLKPRGPLDICETPAGSAFVKFLWLVYIDPAANHMPRFSPRVSVKQSLWVVIHYNWLRVDWLVLTLFSLSFATDFSTPAWLPLNSSMHRRSAPSAKKWSESSKSDCPITKVVHARVAILIGTRRHASPQDVGCAEKSGEVDAKIVVTRWASQKSRRRHFPPSFMDGSNHPLGQEEDQHGHRHKKAICLRPQCMQLLLLNVQNCMSTAHCTAVKLWTVVSVSFVHQSRL